jgi:cation diffusion facilitator family transporter
MKASNNRAIFVSLTVNVLIALTNFVAALVTGSAAMLAEAIQTLVDSTHELFLLLGVHQARAPADERFPYGQGKAVYFWGLIAVVCFMAGGFVAIYNGWQHIVHPDPVEFALVSYCVLTVAIVLNGVALRTVLKQFVLTKGNASFMDAFRNTKNPSMRLLIVQNSLDIAGATLAFCAIYISQATGKYWFDGVASIFVGIMLVGSALWQASRIKNLLIGQSADEYVVEGIRDLVVRQSGVCEIEEITTLHMGPDYILVNLRLKFEDTALVQEIEQVNFYLERQIQALFPMAKRVYVMAAVPSNSFQPQPVMLAWSNRVPVGEEVERC